MFLPAFIAVIVGVIVDIGVVGAVVVVFSSLCSRRWWCD